MIGQNLGGKKHERAKLIVRYTLIFSLMFTALISLVVYFWPKAVFGIFTQDADVLEMGVIYLDIMIIHFFASAVTGSYQSMVIGAGDAKLNFVIGVMDGVICKIGLSILFVNVIGIGAVGYFWGGGLSRIIPGMICIAYFYGGKWKNKELLEP